MSKWRLIHNQGESIHGTTLNLVQEKKVAFNYDLLESEELNAFHASTQKEPHLQMRLRWAKMSTAFLPFKPGKI